MVYLNLYQDLILNKILIFFAFLLCSKSVIADEIKNTTKKPMRCVAVYPTEFNERMVNGKRKVEKINDREENVFILNPTENTSKKRQGTLSCYNQFSYIISYKTDKIEVYDDSNLDSFLNRHNKYDITLYQGKDRDYVDTNFGLAQRCALFNGGEYCNQGFGLDIIYDKSNKVRSILLYGLAVNNGELPFKPESLYKLKSNTEPLGLWIVEHYKEIVDTPATVHTQNLMMWENPAQGIKRITVTPKLGYLKLSHNSINGYSLYREAGKDLEQGMDYIRAIEVEYN